MIQIKITKQNQDYNFLDAIQRNLIYFDKQGIHEYPETIIKIATGFIDKNSQAIYFGDILVDSCMEKYTVEYYYGHACISPMGESEEFKRYTTLSSLALNRKLDYKIYSDS